MTGDLAVVFRRTLDSARLLLQHGDVDGAADRAYYAIFQAAIAALKREQLPVPKTHSGVKNLFSQSLVASGRFSPELMKSFGRVAELRLDADYVRKQVHEADVTWAIEQADLFVTAIERLLASSSAEGQV